MGKKHTEEPNNISFSKLAFALAKDYESIFVINGKDDSFVEYSISGSKNELVVRSSGEDFYSDIIHNVKDRVYPDDQEYVLKTFRKQDFIKRLKKESSVFVNYRLVVKGVPRFYSLKATLSSDDSILIGVLCIEDTVIKQKEVEAENRTYTEVAQSLASLYEVIYHIDINTGHYKEYSSSSAFSKLGLKTGGEDIFTQIKKYVKKYVSPEDSEKVLNILDRDNLVNRLKEDPYVSIIFRQMLDGRMQYVNLIAFRQRSNLERVVVGIVNINDRKMSEKTGAIHSEIAGALAGRSEIIYYIDVQTNEYIRYNGGGSGVLENSTKCRDFFADTRAEINEDIAPDDREMLLAELSKENLIANLENFGVRTVAYRKIKGKKTQYKVLYAVFSGSDHRHIVIAVGVVHAGRKNETGIAVTSGGTVDVTVKDELTNIRNKSAYVFLEEELDRLMSSIDKPEFAIVVCDVNDLKHVNDTKGHKAGDEYIRDACDMICSIFEHSPVFRVGGDEFVVVLRGQDYEKRESLISNLLYEREKNRKLSRVTLAYGISDYDPEKDLRVADVYKRADEAMRLNKKQFKKGKKLVNTDEPILLYRDRPERFNRLFEELILQMTNPRGANIKKIENLLSEIGQMFRLTKGVTRVYRNVDDERKDIGEDLCTFNLHVKDVPVCSVRSVSSVMSIAVMTVYMPEDIEPLSEEELEKIKLVMSCVVSFISRNRLRDLVDRMAFYDDEGYRNYRGFSYYMMEIIPNDRAVAYYNIRQFGIINSEYGKKKADIILKKHYEGLRELIGDRGSVFRLGGDFFLAVFGQEQVDPVSEYLTKTDIGLDDSGARMVPMSTRTGIYIVPSEGRKFDSPDFVSKAAMAYKTAKELDQEAVCFFDEKMGNRVGKVDKIRKDFPAALEKEQFKVYYQPKVDINTGRIVGAESLCRWIKNGKLIPPANFIEVLEKTDDICKLDFYMLEHVCMDLRRWLDEGRKCPRISVNFSRRHMADPRFDETITMIVDKYDIPRELIEIELTETTTDVEFADLKRVVAALQKVGMYTAVDDFGIGYSSLKLIKDIPWNILKVDKNFLPEEGESQDENVEIMYRYVVHMTRDLGIECVTEGVETVEQVRILRENGCEIAQGFLFDMPLPVAEFEARLDGHIYEVYK